LSRGKTRRGFHNVAGVSDEEQYVSHPERVDVTHIHSRRHGPADFETVRDQIFDGVFRVPLLHILSNAIDCVQLIHLIILHYVGIPLSSKKTAHELEVLLSGQGLGGHPLTVADCPSTNLTVPPSLTALKA
jgi:hypothetical protein